MLKPAPTLESLMKFVFSADFKGTCALCYTSIYPGEMLVTKKLTALGVTCTRYVHAQCHIELIESTDDIDLREYETNNIISLD